jgi:hypothetical protein
MIIIEVTKQELVPLEFTLVMDGQLTKLDIITKSIKIK